MTILVGAPKYLWEKHKDTCGDEELQVTKWEPSVFSKEELPDRLINLKWSSINTYTYVEHKMHTACCVCVCVFESYVHV